MPFTVSAAISSAHAVVSRPAPLAQWRCRRPHLCPCFRARRRQLAQAGDARVHCRQWGDGCAIVHVVRPSERPLEAVSKRQADSASPALVPCRCLCRCCPHVTYRPGRRACERIAAPANAVERRMRQVRVALKEVNRSGGDTVAGDVQVDEVRAVNGGRRESRHVSGP